MLNGGEGTLDGGASEVEMSGLDSCEDFHHCTQLLREGGRDQVVQDYLFKWVKYSCTCEGKWAWHNRQDRALAA